MFSVYSPAIHLADTCHDIGDHETEAPCIKIGRRPQTLSVLGITRQEVKVVAHLWDEVLSTGQFLHAAPVVTGETSREHLTIVYGQVAEDTSLQRGKLGSKVTHICPSIYLFVYLSARPSILWSVCPSICSSIYLTIHPFVCLSIHLSVHLSIYLSDHPSFGLYVHPSVCSSIYLYVQPSIWSIHPFMGPSVCLSIHVYACLSDHPYLSIHPFVCVSICLSVSSLLDTISDTVEWPIPSYLKIYVNSDIDTCGFICSFLLCATSHAFDQLYLQMGPGT